MQLALLMASISTKREDWNAIDPVRDVKFLSDCILKEEARLARGPHLPPKKNLPPEIVSKLLPPEMRVSASCVSTVYTSCVCAGADPRSEVDACANVAHHLEDVH